MAHPPTRDFTVRIDRIRYEPSAALDFCEEALSALGALCERTWHDRLQVVAEGRASKLWTEDGTLYAGEICFAPADTSGARDAAREVFPGCPFIFRLAETLRPMSIPIERLILAREAHASPPAPAVAEKLWRSQFPQTRRWTMATPFQAGWHFSLVVLARCEIQAIDQHWSLRRLAMALPSGDADDDLAHDLPLTQPEAAPAADIPWPQADPARWREIIESALAADLEEELRPIRERQENGLRRELERIDDYFGNYASELAARASRASSENARLKGAERLAAAKAEHARRRSDQVNRHEIRVSPHLDALLVVAEPAWQTKLKLEHDHETRMSDAVFVPRARRWEAGL
jgi:hypothetical protein